MLRNRRYKIQKGILPLTLLIAGMLTILYSMVPLFLFLAPSMILNKLVFPEDFNQNILFYLSSLPLSVLGFYLTSVFPWINISQKGIAVKGVYTNRLIKWNEIGDLVEIKGGTILILINRKSFSPFNVLPFERFTGMLLGYRRPVILLSPSLDQREEVLKEITTQLVALKTA